MAGVKNAGAALEDIRIHVKVKISALWVSVMLCYIYGDYFGLYQPRKLQGMQFAFPLPDEIESEDAGPLRCAGATVFTPILQYGVRPTDRVAVVGVGGLRHLAVQYLARWGCDVTAVSSSRDKEEQARELGPGTSSQRVRRTNCGRQPVRSTSSSAPCRGTCRGTSTLRPCGRRASCASSESRASQSPSERSA